MKPLIKKEIRLLLPAWIAAMLLAIIPFVVGLAWVWTVPSSQNELYYNDGPLLFFAPLIFAFGVLFLGINSFGQELSSGTFAALLSQPMERRRVWLAKIAILTVAFVSVLLTAIVFVGWQFDILEKSMRWDAQIESLKFFTFEFLTLSALVTFSGGLWTTLLLRQTTGAFWFSLLIPLAIILGLSAVLDNWMAAGHNINTIVVVALVVYSISGFFYAQRLFFRAQDIPWAGGELSFPGRGKIFEAKAVSVSRRPRHRLSALAWKEIQMHQATLLIAAIMLVLNSFCVVVLKVHPHLENPDLQFVFETIWILWLLMPLLIGAAAIAEERRLGIIESQLCLPVSRRVQLFIKFSVALVISLFLGGMMPWLIECRLVINDWIFAIAAGIFFISFYTSSLARTTLQAIGLTIIFAIFLLYFYQVMSGFFSNPLFGLILLKCYIGAFTLLLVLGALTSWNFKRQYQNWKLRACNIITILAAIVFSSFLATAIYFRVWELILPLEPRGLVRITSPARVKFVADLDTIYAMSPDGRLWVEKLAYIQKRGFNGLSLVIAPDRSLSEFIGDSNWADYAVGDIQAVGIKTDGTLWSIRNKLAPFQPVGGPFTMAQIGLDKDWRQVASDPEGFLLLKQDGSLWALITHLNYGRIRPNRNLKILKNVSASPAGTNSVSKKIKRSMTLAPVQISKKTNWRTVVSTDSSAFAGKEDNTYWIWLGRTGTNYSNFIQETNVDDRWLSLEFNQDCSYVKVKTNGQLWYFRSDLMPQIIGRNVLRVANSDNEQLAQNMKWKTAAFGSLNGIQMIMAIRSDGTLWAFPLIWGYPAKNLLIQLGHRSDWVALMSGFTLAADGSVWIWNQPSDHIWLAPSRRPLCIGNIFQSTETESHETTH